MLTPQQRIEFGKYLRGLREGAGKSLRQVQNECKISPGYLSLVESGERNPPNSDFLRKLARFYGAPPLEVLRRAGRVEEPDDLDLEMDRLDRSYEFVINDKRFSTGHSLSGEPTPDVKRFVVEMYQRLTGLNLLEEKPPLTPDEPGTP